jgi:hypothetical protein
MRFERVKVTRDTNTVHSREAAPWEIPVLEFLFEEGNVVRTGEFVEIKGEYPEASKELDRLVRCYKEDPRSGVPYANMVYGNAQAGVRSLAKLIDDARKDDLAAARKKPTPASTKKPRRAIVADSLLS